MFSWWQHRGNGCPAPQRDSLEGAVLISILRMDGLHGHLLSDLMNVWQGVLYV